MFNPAESQRFVLQIPDVRHDFKVLEFTGTEAISTLYSIHVDLVSEHPDLDLANFLCKPAFLQFGSCGEGIHGLIDDISASDIGKRLTRYEIRLVPALHFLQHSHDHRIFQNLTVPQIIATILNKHGMHTDTFTFHVKPNLAREYCTQYRESDFQFIQRLCAEEGIAWHHQHTCDSHVLVFTDDQTFYPKLGVTPYRDSSGMLPDHPAVSRFSMRLSIRPNKATGRDYDLKRPSALLESSFTTEPCRELEDYRYPMSFEGEKRGKQLARQALERHRTDYQLAEGASNQSALRSGHFFTLSQHPRETYNQLWLLLSITHEGKQPQVLEESLTSGIESKDSFTQGYRNSLSAIPWDVFYRPPMPAPRPLMVSQTARVTGPVGEDIYCDEFGRVKVEFHWDRAERNSEHSSCWLRVAGGWAGEHFGAMTIPRIGMEVLVTHLEGNPDQPLITGCLINKVTAPPYPLPEHKTRTALRSQSTPYTGGYNELSIEDRAGQELVYLRAQRDLEQQVLHDSRLEVGNSHQVSVRGNSHTTVDQTLAFEGGQHVHIKAGQHVVVEGGESISLKVGDQHIVINADGIFSSQVIEVGGSPEAAMIAQALQPGSAVEFLEPITAAPQQTDAEDELEEEEEEVEFEGITLRIGVFFDGTGNNRDNSEMVAGCHARDVSLEKEAEDIQQFCQAFGYDGLGRAPDNSYGNDTSNVAKLYGLYKDDRLQQLPDGETIACIPVYVQGIGTSSGQEDSMFSQTTGSGAQGVLARVAQSPAIILEQVEAFEQVNPDRKVSRVEFDIFGFSRGAAAARHFANDVMKSERSLLAAQWPAKSPMFMEGFGWRVETDIAINFIGLFDTVTAVMNLTKGDFSVHNAKNPDVDVYLPPGIARKIVHLVARDERRHNFSLNSADTADIVVPGVHSDLGGGYLPRVTERVLLSKPRCSIDVDPHVPATSTPAYRAARQELERLQDRLNLYGLPLEIRTWAIEQTRNAKGDRARWKNVYAVVHSERTVRNELALIYLRIMRELAVRHGAQFRSIEKEQTYAMPEELKPIAEKLMAYALGKSPRAGLSLDEEALLTGRYIHLSANWNAYKDHNNSELNIVFINRPAANHVRVVHPNE